MELIVISNLVAVPDEYRILNTLFEAGLQKFHLRRPEASRAEIAHYLNGVDEKFLNRIVLHAHHRLALKFNVAGIHLNESTRLHTTHSEKFLLKYLRIAKPQLTISTSFHHAFDLKHSDKNFDYVFLSPVFESISKPSYQSNFDLKALKEILSKTRFNVVALGGINGERLQIAVELGFKGVAMIGAIWNDGNPLQAFKKITQQCQPVSHIA